jgi:hypothetical protein
MDGVSRLHFPINQQIRPAAKPEQPPPTQAAPPIQESFTPTQPPLQPAPAIQMEPATARTMVAAAPQVAPVAQAPAAFDRNRIPLNFAEAQRYSQLPADSQERHMLLQTFHLNHPDAAWLANKIPKDLKTPQQYESSLERPWNELVEARRVAQLVAQGRQMLKLEGQGINPAEAKAIHYLSREMPVEYEILAADLSKRGEKAAWMVAEARKPDPFDRPPSEATIKNLSERWSQRVSALKLMTQLERQAPTAESAMNFGEARALNFLHSEGLPEAAKLADLLRKRHPSDGWMADQLLQRARSSFSEFSTHDFHRFENRAKEREQAYALLDQVQSSPQKPADWNLSQAEAQACFLLRHDNPQAGESLALALGQRGAATAWALERHCQTGQSVEELKQDWDQLQGARKALTSWGTAPLSQSQVEALTTLAALAPDEAEQLRQQLPPEKASLAWMAGKVMRSRYSTSKPSLEELQNSWESLEKASHTLESSKQWQAGSALVSWDEVDALQTWRREHEPKHYEHIKELLSTLKSRHPDCSWFTNRLGESKQQTPESYQLLLAEYHQLQEARQAAQQFSTPGQTTLTLAEANTLLTLRRLGTEEECKSYNADLTQRGSRVQMAMSLLPDPKKEPSLTSEQFAAIEAKLKEHDGALAVHQTLVSRPQLPVPEGHLPISEEEVRALFQLQGSCWSLAHFMRQALLPRSEFIRHLPSVGNEWKGDLAANLAKQHDIWLLQNAAKRLENDPREGREVRENHFYLGAHSLEQPLGIRDPKQAENFVRVWHRLRASSASPEQVAALAGVPGSERISAGDLQAALAHLQAGGSLEGLTGENARLAARGWDVQAHLPLEQAVQRGSWPLAERLNGGPGPFKRAEIVNSLVCGYRFPQSRGGGN